MLEDQVSTDTLSEHFTPEELQEFTPKDEPVIEQVVEPVVDVPVVEPVEEETPQDSVKVEEEIPHADNLKAALKEERERRKILSAELAALKAQQPTTTQQPAPITTPTQQTSIEDQITKLADEKVRKALEITEDIDTLQYSDPAKYLKYVKGVAKEEFKLETQYEAQSKVYADNQTFVAEMQSQADFATVYQYALAELDEIPGKRSKVISAALYNVDRGIASKQDMDTLKEFTAECRTKMAGVNTIAVLPPVTSPLDKAMGLPRATALSGAKTAGMSWSQVEDLIRQGKTDQIPKEMLSQIDKRLLE